MMSNSNPSLSQEDTVLFKKKRGKKKKEGKLSKLDKIKTDDRLPKKLKKHKGDSHQPSNNNSGNQSSYTAAQNAVNDMMRRALEEDQYSALGSIVDTSTSDSEDDESNVLLTSGPSNKLVSIKLDQKVLQAALRRKLRG